MVPNVRPSNRSGVWTVCPARRSSSAKATTPGVSPCAWWKSTTSAIPALLSCGCPVTQAMPGTLPAHADNPPPDYELRSAADHRPHVESGEAEELPHHVGDPLDAHRVDRPDRVAVHRHHRRRHRGESER